MQEQYARTTINADFFGELKVIFGHNGGEYASALVSNGKIERSTVYFGHQPSDIDCGYEAVRQYISDLGYTAVIKEMTFDNGTSGFVIEINGGLHKGVSAVVYKGKVKLIKIMLSEGEFKITKKATDNDVTRVETNLTMRTETVDLHHPDGLVHLKEAIEKILAP